MIDINEMKTRFGESKEKYRYHLLAIAGGAIAFAANHREIQPDWTVALFLLACLCWLASMLYGFALISIVHRLMAANVSVIEIGRQKERLHPSLHAQAETEIKRHQDRIDLGLPKGETYQQRQVQCLVAGTAIYIAWRIAVLPWGVGA